MKALLMVALPFISFTGFVPPPAPEYVQFMPKITNKVEALLQENQIKVPARMRVEFRIDQKGQISHLSRKISCGDEVLDKKVLKALKKAEPYPNLPTVEGVTPHFLNLQINVEQDKVRGYYLPPF